MRRQRKIILALVLLLAIGFAAVSATLLINGNAKIGTSDFDVYFSSASIDGVENNALISQDGKSITYETANLQVAGDVSKLDYTITNNSSQYDAEVKIECDFSGNEYVTLENSLQNDVIEAKTEKEGTLTATLIKTSTEERSQSFTCIVVASAVERETTGEDVVVEGESSTYSVYGTLTDENGAALANQVVVAYSDPVYTTTDEFGYFYMEGIEKGSHTLYVMGEVSIDDVNTLSEEEVATQATTKGDFTTNTVNIAFENGYTLEDEVVEKTKKYDVSFDVNGGVGEVATISVTKGLAYGELPTLTKDEYDFIGWYDENDVLITKDTKSSHDNAHTLIAKWRIKLVFANDVDADGIADVEDEILIDDQQFYVVSNDGETINLLAKYNLYVGGEYSNSTWTAYENPTGIQDSTMMGATNESVYNGITAFSSVEQKGANYSDYEGSIVESYVNDYVGYLNTNYNINATGRLLEAGEYTGNGYDDTSYWTKTKGIYTYKCEYGTCPFGDAGTVISEDSTSMIISQNSSTFNPGITESDSRCAMGRPYCILEVSHTGIYYSSKSNYGVRPVITISADLL